MRAPLAVYVLASLLLYAHAAEQKLRYVEDGELVFGPGEEPQRRKGHLGKRAQNLAGVGGGDLMIVSPTDDMNSSQMKREFPVALEHSRLGDKRKREEEHASSCPKDKQKRDRGEGQEKGKEKVDDGDGDKDGDRERQGNPNPKTKRVKDQNQNDQPKAAPTFVEGPRILALSRKELKDMTKDEKLRLTEDLTPQQWNEFFEKWSQEEDDLGLNFTYYITLLEDSERLELMKAALEGDLGYLFASMCHPAYFLDTPQAIELLEEGFIKYPDLRRDLLFTAYNLGHPVGKWYFSSSEEGDLETFEELIKESLITEKDVIKFLPEVAELDPEGNLVEFLVERKYLTIDDLCNTQLYYKACGSGKRAYLQWVKKLCPAMSPDQQCVDAVVSGGHNSVLEFLEAELGTLMVPSQEAVDKAAENGKLEVLRNRCNKWQLFPTEASTYNVASNGHLDVLKWMASLESPVHPDGWGADGAAKNGHLDVLEWMARLVLPIYPDGWGANWAAENGHLNVLKWMASLESAVYPTVNGANKAAENGHLDVLEWMAGLEPPVYPTVNGANGAARRGHLNVLEWMASLGSLAYPTVMGANEAAANGRLDVLKWMASLESPIYPTAEGANEAAANGHLDVLKWMVALNSPIYPTERY